MRKIEIQDRDNKTIYTHEEEGNTIRKTVQKAHREGVNLDGCSIDGDENVVLNAKRRKCSWAEKVARSNKKD